MPGRVPRSEVSRELQRFSWLVSQLEQKGIGQAEMARRTGIESSHINKLRSFEKYGRKSLGADIIRQVRDGLRVDVAYFFDDYTGQRDHSLYPLSAKRDEKRVSSLEDADSKHELAIAEMKLEIAQLKSELRDSVKRKRAG